jgi:hypothetical protein
MFFARFSKVMSFQKDVAFGNHFNKKKEQNFGKIKTRIFIIYPFTEKEIHKVQGKKK